MVKIFHLPNGVTCICEERPQTGLVSMQVSMKLGSINETPEENGLTFLMQEACNGGTATRTRTQISEEIESNGGSLGTVSGRTTTNFLATALTQHAKDAFTILADMIRHPVFSADEVQKTKAQIDQWILQLSESPEDKAEAAFYEAAFSGQAAGRLVMGSQELLASFTPAQVKQQHARLLAHPENIVISFTGDIDAAQAEKWVKGYFSDLTATAPEPAPQLAFTEKDIREANENDQLNLVFGFKAPSVTDPDKYAMTMLTEYLSGGMSSPLFQEIREKRGLVYGVYANHVTFDTNGLFNISAGAGKGNAGELVSVAMNVLGKTIRDGIDQKTLAQTRERLVRQAKDAREKARGACSIHAIDTLTYGRPLSLQEYDEQLKQVTSDDIRRVCADMLRDGKYALSAIGPQDTMPSGRQIKDMMYAQLQNTTIPLPSPVRPSIKELYSQTAKKTADSTSEAKITTLKNGMKIVTLERPGNMACGAWVGAGSDNETPALNGATHMNEHMMFKGTPSYAPGEIDKIVEGELGANLNAYTGNDRTAYYFYSLEEDSLEKIVDICGEMVFQANLEHAEFDGKITQNPDGPAIKAKGERDVVIEELKRANDNVDRQAWQLLYKTIYPDQPHGRPVLGTEETLRAMTVQQLAAYRDECYAPNNVVFCAAGPIRHEDFVALLEKKYGQLPAKNFPSLPAPDYRGGTAFIEYKNATLCNLILGAEGVSTAHPDNLAYRALGKILGGGTSSRLYKEAVIRKGLSAGVDVGLDEYRNGGLFQMSASMAPEKIRPFIDTVYKELRGLAGNLTQQELDKTKACLKSEILSDLETNRSACDVYACNTLAYGKLVTRAEIEADIQKLTINDVKRIANKVLHAVPALAMVVPSGTDLRYLPKQDEVVALRDGKGPQDGLPRPEGPGV